MFDLFAKIKYKIIIAIITLGIILLFLQLITAYMFGVRIEQQIDTQFKHLSDSAFISVINRSYQRGIFSSDVDTEIKINSSLLNNITQTLPQNNKSAITQIINQGYVMKYHTHIQHGILTGILNGYSLPTLAYARTTIEYSDQVNNLLNKLFNNQVPFEIDNIIYLNGSGKIKVYSPKFDYTEPVAGVRVVWGGLTTSITYKKDFKDFNTQVNIPLLQLTAPQGIINFAGFKYTSDSRISNHKIILGSTNLIFNQLQIKWKDKISVNFKLGDILNMLSGIDSLVFLNDIDPINPNDFVVTDINYLSHSDINNNYFSTHTKISVESFVTNSSNNGPIQIDLGIEHIAVAPLAHLLNSLTIALKKNNNTDTLQLFPLVKNDFALILHDNPLMNINQFNMHNSTGDINIDGVVTTHNFNLSDIDNPNTFMQKISTNISMSVPKSVLSYLLMLQTKYLLSVGHAQIDQQSSIALNKVVNILLDNKIHNWINLGYLSNHNGIINTIIKMESGNVYLNGKLKP
jgi:uncharacterized protein YdgA (DUF945 family)